MLVIQATGGLKLLGALYIIYKLTVSAGVSPREIY